LKLSDETKKYSTTATKNLEKIRKYTNELSGVNARTLNPKRTSPIASEISRRFDVTLNLVGGIGMYHIRTHMTKKTSRFKVLSPRCEYYILGI